MTRSESQRRWYQENREQALEDMRRRYQENREERLEYQRRWSRENRDRSLEKDRRRHRENRDQLNAERRQRRLKSGSKTPRERQRDEIIVILWTRQDGRCYLCEEPVSLKDAVLEHDHACCPPRSFCRFCIRGMSCQECNLVIGQAHDDPDRLERIAQNLRTALAEVRRAAASKPVQLSLDLADEA